MRLEILIGMIASGKSTYARHRADEGALVICHDDLTEMLHKRYRYEADLRPVYMTMMQDLAFHAIRASRRDVVIDRTNLTRAAREEWINFVNDIRPSPPVVQIEAVVFPRDSVNIHAYRRTMRDARGRERLEWLGVAKHHAEQMDKEPVTLAEGFDSIVNVPVADIKKWAAEPNPFPAYLPPREVPDAGR